MYGRAYDNTRFSPLSQINTENLGQSSWRLRSNSSPCVVYTENSNSNIMVMQSAKDRVGMDTSSSLNWARERRVLI
jgi:hypothetical protein